MNNTNYFPGGDDPILEDANKQKILNEEEPISPEVENTAPDTAEPEPEEEEKDKKKKK